MGDRITHDKGSEEKLTPSSVTPGPRDKCGGIKELALHPVPPCLCPSQPPLVSRGTGERACKTGQESSSKDENPRLGPTFIHRRASGQCDLGRVTSHSEPTSSSANEGTDSRLVCASPR